MKSLRMQKIMTMKRHRSLPQRRCVGCGKSFDQGDLCRVRKDLSGYVVLDMDRSHKGRSAYVCKNPDCVADARKKRGLERSLRCAVPAEIYDALKEEVLSR